MYKRVVIVVVFFALAFTTGAAAAKRYTEVSTDEKAWNIVTNMVLGVCTESMEGITKLALRSTTEYAQWEPFIDQLAQCGVMLQALPDPPSKYAQIAVNLRSAGREYSLAAQNYRIGIQQLDRVRLSKAADGLDNGYFYLDRADRTYPEQ